MHVLYLTNVIFLFMAHFNNIWHENNLVSDFNLDERF